MERIIVEITVENTLPKQELPHSKSTSFIEKWNARMMEILKDNNQ